MKYKVGAYLRLSKEEFSNEEFVGKHLSSITLRTFIEQYSDEEADRFIIDSEFDNDIAFKCHKGAGFVDVDKYVVMLLKMVSLKVKSFI